MAVSDVNLPAAGDTYLEGRELKWFIERQSGPRLLSNSAAVDTMWTPRQK